MASTFGGFEIAKAGMQAYNAAIQTTAHNIANVETKGYSKQTANMISMTSSKGSFTVQGAGVTVSDISRERNEYFDIKYQSTMSTYSKYSTQSYYLTCIEDFMYTSDDKEGGIISAFDDFYTSITNLTNDATSSTIRTEVITKAETFTSFVSSLATNLQQLQEEANTEIKSCVDQINALADKIASINRQINMVESYGSTANDLRDQRTVLIDELSKYCNVETSEKTSSDGVGEPQFYVYVNGGILVDTYNVNSLKLEQKDSYSNINDVTGCYDIKWSDDSSFNCYSNTLGGKLQALFETRDGNNSTTLQGKLTGLSNNAAGNQVLTLTGTNCNDLQKLNIPASDGEITINNTEYKYDSFSVQVDADGNYTYQFVLKDTGDVADATNLQVALTRGSTATVGDEVAAKGIPYYMAQLNEFVRTFAQEFNEIQNQGYDADNKLGVDFFNATVAGTGDNYVFTEKGDGNDASFSSVATQNADGTYTGSYYYMTAMNFGVTQEVAADPGKLACKGSSTDGSGNTDNLVKLMNLKDDSTMFVHGAPDSFIQSMTAAVGVDSKKASTMEKSQSNLLYAVDSNRQSVSGVDEDEEGADLITFQNMLMNQYKVLSVMNEVLDKLINGTV